MEVKKCNASNNNNTGLRDIVGRSAQLIFSQGDDQRILSLLSFQSSHMAMRGGGIACPESMDSEWAMPRSLAVGSLLRKDLDKLHT